MSNAKLHFGGVPAGPDINRIRDRFPDNQLAEGQEILYEEIAAIIGEPPHSNRFKTVTEAWRRRVQSESNVFIGCVPGRAFRVLTPRERFEESHKKTRTGLKSVRKGVILHSSVQRHQIPESERQRFDHLARVQKQVLAAQKLSAKSELPSISKPETEEDET